MQKNSKYKLSSDRKLTQKEYKTTHARVGKVIH